VAFQFGFDLAQAARAANLRMQHRHQMSLARHHPIIPVGVVTIHEPIEDPPRNRLQKAMKNDILMLRGVDPFSCSVDSQPLESK
jgi:hypothetical protein